MSDEASTFHKTQVTENEGQVRTHIVVIFDAVRGRVPQVHVLFSKYAACTGRDHGGH